MTTLTGIVRDTQKKALAHTDVRLTYTRGLVGFGGGAAVRKTHEAKTNAQGLLTVPNLVPGEYDIVILAPASTSDLQTKIDRRGVVVIPDQSSVTLEDALTVNFAPVTPTSVQQANAAAQAAQGFSQNAQDAAQDAQNLLDAIPFFSGWSPVFNIATDGARRVLQIDDWVGGEGTKPSTGDYVGASGLVSDIAQAVDIRGSEGGQGDAGWSPILAVVSDDDRRVFQVADWVGGEGTKPSTGDYVGASGLTATISEAINIRGPVGAGTGDMLVATYDPQEIEGDAFDRANHTGTQEANTITGLANVATTGNYSDLTGLPSLFDGAYSSLSGVPSEFPPQAHNHTVSQITDFPNFADVATSGDYDDLSNKPTIPSLNDAELTGDIYANGSYRGNVVAVAALDIDCSAGNYFTKSISANSTFTFSNVPASRAYAFTLAVTVSGDRAITWPASVEFPGDEAPTLTAGKTHLFMFATDNGGTTFRGAALADYEA